MLSTRSLRAAAASVVVAGCGSGAHLLAGGDVAAWVLPVLVLGTFPVALAVATGRLTTGQLLGLLVLGQVAAHLLAGHAPVDGRTMTLAHVAATAVSLLVVRHGEDAWWRVADALELFVQRLGPVPTLPAPRRHGVRVVAEPWFPRPEVLVTGTGGRAPPTV